MYRGQFRDLVHPRVFIELKKHHKASGPSPVQDFWAGTGYSFKWTRIPKFSSLGFFVLVFLFSFLCFNAKIFKWKWDFCLLFSFLFIFLSNLAYSSKPRDQSILLSWSLSPSLMLWLLEFWRWTLQLRLGPIPRFSRKGAKREAACAFVFHWLNAKILHATSVCKLQVEVATLDCPVHLKAESQAGILYQVYIDLLGDGLQLVSIQVGQRNLLHLNW